jgi:hypothetical protein
LTTRKRQAPNLSPTTKNLTFQEHIGRPQNSSIHVFSGQKRAAEEVLCSCSSIFSLQNRQNKDMHIFEVLAVDKININTKYAGEEKDE